MHPVHLLSSQRVGATYSRPNIEYLVGVLGIFEGMCDSFVECIFLNTLLTNISVCTVFSFITKRSPSLQFLFFTYVHLKAFKFISIFHYLHWLIKMIHYHYHHVYCRLKKKYFFRPTHLFYFLLQNCDKPQPLRFPTWKFQLYFVKLFA